MILSCNPTVKEIVEDYLKTNGFDGLFHDRWDTCACDLNDLMACEEGWDYCIAGYKYFYKEDDDQPDGHEDADWCMQIDKPKTE